MFKPFLKLYDEQGENGGAGGGGATAPLTAEDIAKLVNQAVTSQLSRALPKALEGTLSTFTKSLDEKFAAMKPAEPVTPDDKGKGPNPELTAMQRKIDELLAANKASEERAQAVERKSREDAAFGELRAELGKHIKPEFVDPIAKSLYYADKRVEFGEDGKPLFRALVPQYQGGPLQETTLPLRDGVEAFAKSKEAEAYRPPPTVKNPQAPLPRIQQGGGSQLPSGGNKIPTTTEDPGWAARMTAELAAQGVPTGALE